MAGLTPFSLSAAIASIGVAEVYIGDPITAINGMLSLGGVEGTIDVSPGYNTNPLTAPELTGDVAHQMVTTLGNVTVKIPLIIADMSVIPKISPTGTTGGGFSIPQKAQETAVLIVPRNQVGGNLVNTTGLTAGWTRTAGNGIVGASGAPAAPINAIWFWRATPTYASLPFQYANGGKIIIEVTFTAMFDGTKPEGHKVFTIGDPTAIPTTPIAVKI
jgi:hypothetical protein